MTDKTKNNLLQSVQRIEDALYAVDRQLRQEARRASQGITSFKQLVGTAEGSSADQKAAVIISHRMEALRAQPALGDMKLRLSLEWDRVILPWYTNTVVEAFYVKIINTLDAYKTRIAAASRRLKGKYSLASSEGTPSVRSHSTSRAAKIYGTYASKLFPEPPHASEQCDDGADDGVVMAMHDARAAFLSHRRPLSRVVALILRAAAASHDDVKRAAYEMHCTEIGTGDMCAMGGGESGWPFLRRLYEGPDGCTKEDFASLLVHLPSGDWRQKELPHCLRLLYDAHRFAADFTTRDTRWPDQYDRHVGQTTPLFQRLRHLLWEHSARQRNQHSFNCSTDNDLTMGWDHQLRYRLQQFHTELHVNRALDAAQRLSCIPMLIRDHMMASSTDNGNNHSNNSSDEPDTVTALICDGERWLRGCMHPSTGSMDAATVSLYYKECPLLYCMERFSYGVRT